MRFFASDWLYFSLSMIISRSVSSAYQLLALSMAGSACPLKILSDTRTTDSSSEIPPHKMASRKDFPIWPANSVPPRPHCRRSPHPLLPSAGREPAFPYILPEVREDGPVLLPDAAEYLQTRCSRIPSFGFSDPAGNRRVRPGVLLQEPEVPACRSALILKCN